MALAERLVSFTELTIPEANFSTLPKDQVKTVVSEIVEAIPRGDRIIALDRVLANIDTSQIVPKNVEGVKADPPVIFYSPKPAVLVVFDGDPIWSPIDGNDLKFAVNTNWDLFEHAVTKTYFLRVDNSWMTASAVQGTVDARRQAARQFREAARRRELERREGGAAGPEDRGG